MDKKYLDKFVKYIGYIIWTYEIESIREKSQKLWLIQGDSANLKHYSSVEDKNWAVR